MGTSPGFSLRRLCNASVAIKASKALSGVKVALFLNLLNLLIRIPFIFSRDTYLSRETLIKENFLVSQVFLTIWFYTVLTEIKGTVGYKKYW